MKKYKITIAVIVLMTFMGTASALNHKDTAPGKEFDINQYSWLVGHWTGDGFGGVSDEVWSTPSDGVMMGMYRNIQDGKVAFYEFITLDETGMKLKHFQPDMEAWEEKADFVHFELIEATANKLSFKGLSFELKSENEMEIALKMKNNGKIETEYFHMKRVTP